MGSTRAISIPIEHVIAEMAAFPLGSEAAFQLAITHLPMPIDFAARNDALWRAAEREMVHSCPSFSLDELIEMRDRLWYPHDATPGTRNSLADYLQRLATSYLKPQGSLVVPWSDAADVQGDPEGDARHAVSRRKWRWLSFALPPDLLTASLSTPTEPDYRPVSALSPCVERLLADLGFVETHLHVGAGMGFHVLWMATLYRLAENGLKENVFKSPGAAFDEGRQFAAWLIRAAVARYLLTAFLAYRRDFGFAGRSFR